MYKESLSRFRKNLIGRRTNRKIVIIESDDWGSIRMPSKKIYNHLISSGIKVDECPYNRYDALESEVDLSNLFDVLTSIKDIKGNFPVVTANMVVANPDFERIKKSKFQKYTSVSYTHLTLPTNREV